MRLDVCTSSTPGSWSSYSARASFSSLCLKSLFVLSLTAPLGIAQTPKTARQPLSPEMLSIHQLAKRPTSKPDDAINQGYRGQMREEFQILTFVQDGLITGPGGAAFGSSGFSINCPIVQRLD